MRRFAKINIIIATLALLPACVHNTGNSGNTASKEGRKAVREKMVGAYGEQREITEEELEMFRCVTDDGGDIIYTPLSVSTQVVAGINYKFRCRFEDTSDGVRRKSADDSDRYGYCWVTIYKPLPGNGEPKVTRIDR